MEATKIDANMRIHALCPLHTNLTNGSNFVAQRSMNKYDGYKCIVTWKHCKLKIKDDKIIILLPPEEAYLCNPPI